MNLQISTIFYIKNVKGMILIHTKYKFYEKKKKRILTSFIYIYIKTILYLYVLSTFPMFTQYSCSLKKKKVKPAENLKI